MMFLQQILCLAIVAPNVRSMQDHSSRLPPTFHDVMVYDEELRCARIQRRRLCPHDGYAQYQYSHFCKLCKQAKARMQGQRSVLDPNDRQTPRIRSRNGNDEKNLTSTQAEQVADFQAEQVADLMFKEYTKSRTRTGTSEPKFTHSTKSSVSSRAEGETRAGGATDATPNYDPNTDETRAQEERHEAPKKRSAAAPEQEDTSWFTTAINFMSNAGETINDIYRKVWVDLKEDCPICLSKRYEGKGSGSAKRLPCNCIYEYHTACLKPLLKSNTPNGNVDVQCPTCRKKFNLPSYFFN